MFNVGMPELLVIAGIALIILGPEKFPTQAKVFLRMVREFREHWDDAKRDIMNELNPVKKEFRDLRKFKPEELLDKLTGEGQQAMDEVAKVIDGPATTSAAPTNTAPATGANEAPVEFEGGVTAAAEGRSEDSQWERKDVAPAALTEEDEYRASLSGDNDRPKDGSD